MRFCFAFVVCPVLAISSTLASDPSRSSSPDRELKPTVHAFRGFEQIYVEPVPMPRDESQSEVEYSPGMDVTPKLNFGQPIRIIGHLIAAPAIESSFGGIAASRSSAVHPDEIQFHFSALADLLSSSGLSSEAKTLSEIQESFQRDSYPRLLLAHKESQLRILQSEIATLKKNLEVAEPTVIELKLAVLEVNRDARQRLCNELASLKRNSKNEHSTALDLSSDVVERVVELDAIDVGDLLKRVADGGGAKVLSRPAIRTIAGQNAEVNVMHDAGLGISIKIQPSKLESSRLKLGMMVEVNYGDQGKRAQQNSEGDVVLDNSPLPVVQRVEAWAEIERGTTLAVVGQPRLAANAGDEEKYIVVTVSQADHVATAAKTSGSTALPAPRLPRITSRPAPDKSPFPTY